MLADISRLSKYINAETGVRITDGFFLIQSKATITILLFCTVLISTKQFFGEAIQCIGDENDKEYINTFCWTMGTYIMSNCQNLIRRSNVKQFNNIIAEGICPGNTNEEERIYLRYYQWVVVILMVQAIAFYFPSFLWNIWEGNRLKQLCSDIGRW